MKSINESTYNELLNKVLDKAAILVRDVNLPENLEEKYIPGIIILEKGFTDASHRVGGMVTTHRYTILSNHMADLAAFDEDTNWGMVMANLDAHFLVLDKYTYNGKTQILLLHLPDDINWKQFKNVQLAAFNEIIIDLREKFKYICKKEAIPELTVNNWLNRCTAPLGMDREGNYFNLEFSLSMHFYNIGEADFRDLLNKIIYVELEPSIKKRFEDKIDILSEDDGLLMYGYIDETAGFSFHVLCSANIRDNTLKYGSLQTDTRVIIRKGQLNDSKYLSMNFCEFDYSVFKRVTEAIDKGYQCTNKDTEQMRDFKFLDPVRNIDFPDDIKVLLIKDNLKIEQVWVKCWEYTEDELFGKLLNEPEQDFGIHRGYIIGFAPVKHDDKLFCVYTGRYLQVLEN